jgi:hypothetical protein
MTKTDASAARDVLSCPSCDEGLLDDLGLQQLVVDGYLLEVAEEGTEVRAFLNFARDYIVDYYGQLLCNSCEEQYHLYHCIRCGNDLLADYSEEALNLYRAEVEDLAKHKDWEGIMEYGVWLEEVFLPDQSLCSWCEDQTTED